MNESLSPSSSQESLPTLVRVLDRLKAEQQIGSPEATASFLKELDYEDFRTWLDTINGLARGIPTPERGFGGGTVVYQKSTVHDGILYQPPLEDRREPLMRDTLDAIKDIEDPALAGLVFGFALNAIHPYPDGNGRTARMGYALLAHGYEGTPESKQYYAKLLENREGRDVINPNPSTHGVDSLMRMEMMFTLVDMQGYTADTIPQAMWGGYGATSEFEGALYDPEGIPMGPDTDSNDRAIANHVLSDTRFAHLVVMRAFPPERVAPYLKTREHDGLNYLNGNAFISSLSHEEFDALLKGSIAVKNSYIRRLLTIAERPDSAAILKQYAPVTPASLGTHALRSS